MLKMNQKNTRRTLAIIAALLSIYGIVFIISKHYLNSQEIRKILTAQIADKLHTTVTMSDDIGFSLSWNLSPHLTLNKLVITNMLSVESLDLHFSLLDLVGKKFNVKNLTLIKPTIYFNTVNDKNNWDLTSPPANTATTTPSSKVKLHIGEISISEGLVSYKSNAAEAINIQIDSLHITNNADNTIYNLQFKLLLGASDLVGKLKVDTKHKNITGKINSNVLNVKDFSTPGNSSGQYSIPNQELPIEFLTDLTIDIPIQINKLVLNLLTFENVKILITENKNQFKIGLTPAVNLAEGKIQANLKYDLQPSTPQLSFDLHTTPISLEELFKQVRNKTPITGSELEVKTNLNSQGTNLQTLVGNLNGKILATVSPGQYLNSDASLGTIFTNILSAMITFDKRQDFTKINCAVVNFKVNNGIAVANNGIGLEASSVNVTGSGQVNLKNGVINFSITPQNTKTNFNPVDIAQISMAQMITVTGTISKPQVSLDPLGMFKGATGAALTKTLMTVVGGIPGGLAAVAQGEIEPSATPTTISPCKQALGN